MKCFLDILVYKPVKFLIKLCSCIVYLVIHKNILQQSVIEWNDLYNSTYSPKYMHGKYLNIHERESNKLAVKFNRKQT